MKDDILKLNEPGQVIEVTQEEAAELGAFEEDALDEFDAFEAIERQGD
ncbi:hypothetical protein [Vibrio parahaemolyticus]|nr:hypothetical protein [Vibrio parahaemolyticus]HCE5184915.1 conjugal transfer protein TraD [Vibrio parahaemolyticus]